MKIIWQKIHKFGSLKYIYTLSSTIIPALSLLCFILLAYGTLQGLFFVPIDYQQKDAFRIIYIHVPCALLSLSIYTLIGINSIIYLVWRIKICDVIAQQSATTGAIFTLLALISGSIWGKPMWGTWWVWDARLTSELILLFLYCGYISLRNSIHNEKVAAVAAAILATIGLLDIPIIHFSVEWWYTLHQGATISKFAKPAIASEMLYPLLAMLAGCYALFILILAINVRTSILWRERNTKWVNELIWGDKIGVNA